MADKKQFAFGSGTLYGVRTDVTPATPAQFGILQDVSVDFSFDVKELKGQYQMPVAVARGSGKISIKAKFAQLNGGMLNDLFFQGTKASGETLVANNEGPAGGTAIPATPFQITVTNSANFVDDLGVVDAATGTPFTKVASGPTAGQYSVAAGVYTFASADNVSGRKVYISYSYTAASQGNVITISNQLLGVNPVFAMHLSDTYNGQQVYLKLNQCTSTKLMIASKLEDFWVPEFDASAFADSSGNIGTLSLANAD
jgi:hypothetical protein